VVDHDAASRQKAAQRLVFGEATLQARRRSAGDQRGLVEDLTVGLAGVLDQRRAERSAGNAEGDPRWGRDGRRGDRQGRQQADG